MTQMIVTVLLHRVVVHYFTKNKTMRKGECYGAGIGNGIGAKGNYDGFICGCTNARA